MKNLLIIPFLFAGIIFNTFGWQEPPHKISKVVIDAGHGGFDPGCHGVLSQEKEVTLMVAKELGKLINTFHEDVEVIFTRDKDNYITLNERAKIANNVGADLFISIHCNAHPKKHIFGAETYVMGLSSSDENLSVAMRENAVILKEEGYEENYDGFDPNSPVSYIMMANYQNAFQDISLHFASKIQNQFTEEIKRTDRGVKQAGFWVLAKTTMPSVLVEIGFLSNKEEEKYINSEVGKAEITTTLYKAFRNFKMEYEKSN
ncbi:MAG: N-acetylmuramoyl-L-alanine amidase [Flammeovirgaceae bacterium]|nr:N-acetylmuramoyl-L-alanine amidase [Flammeovirgaceae bacterium]